MHHILALEDGSPIFRQVISHLTYYFSNVEPKVVVIPKSHSDLRLILIITGLSPSMVCYSKQILILIRK